MIIFGSGYESSLGVLWDQFNITLGSWEIGPHIPDLVPMSWEIGTYISDLAPMSWEICHRISDLAPMS